MVRNSKTQPTVRCKRLKMSSVSHPVSLRRAAAVEHEVFFAVTVSHVIFVKLVHD